MSGPEKLGRGLLDAEEVARAGAEALAAETVPAAPERYAGPRWAELLAPFGPTVPAAELFDMFVPNGKPFHFHLTIERPDTGAVAMAWCIGPEPTGRWYLVPVGRQQTVEEHSGPRSLVSAIRARWPGASLRPYFTRAE